MPKIGVGNIMPDVANLPGQNSGGGPVAETKFVMDVVVASDGDIVTLKSQGGGVWSTDYNVDWGDGNSNDNVTTDVSHEYDSAGTYTIKVDGTWAPDLYGDVYLRNADVTLKNWGTTDVTFESLESTFRQFADFKYEATDYPTLNLVNGQNNRYPFYLIENTAFTGTLDISDWDFSGATSSIQNSFYRSFNNGKFLADGNTIGGNYCGGFLYEYGKNLPLGDGDIVMKNISWPNVTNFAQIFQNVNGISDLSNWTLKAAPSINCSRMFYGAKTKSDLTTLDLSSWSNTGSITVHDQMFRNFLFTNPEGKGALDLTGWDLTNSTTLYFMFYNAPITEIIGLSGLELGAGKLAGNDLSYTFGYMKHCSLANHNFGPNFWNKTGNVTDFRNMFLQFGVSLSGGDIGPAPANIDSLDTSSGQFFSNAFKQSHFNSNIDLSGWDLSSAQNMSSMFYLNRGQTDIDLSSTGITSSLTDLTSSFRNMYDLTSISFGTGASANDLSGITSYSHCFYATNNLTSIEFPTNASFASVTNTGMTNFLYGGTMTTAEYNNLLIRFEATNNVNPGGAFRVNATFSLGTPAEAARTALIARGWTFTDGGGV